MPLRLRTVSTPRKIFLCGALLGGLLLLGVTPPFQVADEPAHFFRAFQISEGRFVAERTETGIGGFLPECVAETVLTFDDLPIHADKKQEARNILIAFRMPCEETTRTFLHFPNTGLYSPVPYLPQVAGISAGRLFGLSPLALMYLGRLCNLCVWMVLVCSAIALIPFQRWTMVLLALTPMSLAQASSLSADAVTNGIAFLLTAVLLRSAFADDQTLTNEKICAVALLSSLLALCKYLYFPIAALFLLIPVSRAGGARRYWTAAVFIAASALLSSFLWGLSIWQLYRDAYSLYRDFAPTVSPRAQVQFITSQPWTFVHVIGRTVALNGMQYVTQFIGQLGWLDTSLPRLLIIGYLAMIVVVAVLDSPRGMSLKRADRLLAGTVGAFISLSIVVSFYATMNPVGAQTVTLQGRYFIPLSPLFAFLLLTKRRRETDRSWLGSAVVLTVLSSSLCTIWTLMRRYYG